MTTPVPLSTPMFTSQASVNTSTVVNSSVQALTSLVTSVQEVTTQATQLVSKTINTTLAAVTDTSTANITGLPINSTNSTDGNSDLSGNDDKNFLNNLGVKDETLFVGLIITCLVVPTIFVSIFALICIRRQKERKARRAQMLLRNPADVPMEEFPYMATLHSNSGIVT
ncbi:hypothetical protein ScPMuIL_002981 [Solemya velum]